MGSATTTRSARMGATAGARKRGKIPPTAFCWRTRSYVSHGQNSLGTCRGCDGILTDRAEGLYRIPMKSETCKDGVRWDPCSRRGVCRGSLGSRLCMRPTQAGSSSRAIPRSRTCCSAYIGGGRGWRSNPYLDPQNYKGFENNF